VHGVDKRMCHLPAPHPSLPGVEPKPYSTTRLQVGLCHWRAVYQGDAGLESREIYFCPTWATPSLFPPPRLPSFSITPFPLTPRPPSPPLCLFPPPFPSPAYSLGLGGWSASVWILCSSILSQPFDSHHTRRTRSSSGHMRRHFRNISTG
jgi:hypothetical protein